MKRGFVAMSTRRVLFVFASILVYILVFALLIFMKMNEGSQEQKTVFGSMEGRFRSSIVLEHEGDTLYYRQNEITNYLVIGLDKTDLQQVTVYQRGGQADFMVVLSIDRRTRTVTPIMLDRDTMTDVQTYGIFGHPSGSKVMQLCLAQAYAPMRGYGSVNTVNSVENLLCGIKIDHYITIDISAIPVLNDVIGGVEVTLMDDFTVYDPEMVKGATIRLEGEQAEFFVRGRMTVADGTNVSRMTRQQQYIDGFMAQLRQAMEEDSNKMVELLDAVSGHMQTDASRDTLLHDAGAYEDYTWKTMKTLEGTHRIDEYRFAEFWVDEEAMKDLVADIWFMKEEVQE